MLKKYYDTPFFFSSRALQASNYVTVELKHIYRQDDPDFIRILNEVRSGTVDNQTLDALNKRYIPDFNPPQKDGYVRLVTHNNQAKQVNELERHKKRGQASATNKPRGRQRNSTLRHRAEQYENNRPPKET